LVSILSFSVAWFLLVVACLVVSTSAIDCLGRLVFEMTYYVSRETLNSTHSVIKWLVCSTANNQSAILYVGKRTFPLERITLDILRNSSGTSNLSQHADVYASEAYTQYVIVLSFCEVIKLSISHVRFSWARKL